MNTIEIDYEDFVENLFQNPPSMMKSPSCTDTGYRKSHRII